MKLNLLLLALAALLLGSAGAQDCECEKGKGMDNTQARGYFKSFMHRFDDLSLCENDNRTELQWFIDQGEHGRDFVRDAFNDRNLSSRERFAALYIYCKGWPVNCEGRLAKCERSKEIGFTDFGRRLREHLAGEVLQEHQVR